MQNEYERANDLKMVANIFCIGDGIIEFCHPTFESS